MQLQLIKEDKGEVLKTLVCYFEVSCRVVEIKECFHSINNLRMYIILNLLNVCSDASRTEPLRAFWIKCNLDDRNGDFTVYCGEINA